MIPVPTSGIRLTDVVELEAIDLAGLGWVNMNDQQREDVRQIAAQALAREAWARANRHQPSIVTICGSTRFRAEIAEANRMLTLQGHIVLAPGVFGHDGDEMTDEQKAALDELHFRKIDLADQVYVVNPGGYIGESTRLEISYARRTGKAITRLVEQATTATRPRAPHKFCAKCSEAEGSLHKNWCQHSGVVARPTDQAGGA